MLQANEVADNEDGTVKKRSVASDQELIAAHERKIRAWTQFIHTAITSEMQNKQHIDADDCLAIGEAFFAVLAVQLTTLATENGGRRFRQWIAKAGRSNARESRELKHRAAGHHAGPLGLPDNSEHWQKVLDPPLHGAAKAQWSEAGNIAY
jgi:hypothetical protein